MIIRKFESADRPCLEKMMREFYDSPALIGDIPQNVILRNMDNLLQGNPFLEGWIFEEDGVIAGYSMIAKSYSTEAGGNCIWIEDIYLRGPYRGRGIGQKFFDHVWKLYGDSAVRIRLEAEKDNENAIRFYRRNGYRELKYVQLVLDCEQE